MNPSPDNTPHEVFALCDRLLDGTFTVEDRERLESLVLTDASARLAYLEYTQIHTGLKDARLKEVSLAEVVNMVPDHATRPVRQKSGWGRAMLPAAAALAILSAGWGMGAWKADTAHRAQTVATIVESKGARWDSGTMSTALGAELPTGRLRLSAGLATLEFRKGARLTLEGPADLELVSAGKCYLHSGALTAHVPPQAVGFIVETAHARLVDHGTDFGISTAAAGEAQVQVFQGEVELQHASSGEKLSLLTKQSASITPGALSLSSRLEDETSHAPVRVSEPVGPNVLSLTTSDTAGKAAYAWSPETKTHFSETLLLLKNAAVQACRRKAWLGFDLSRLQGREIQNAVLTLTFEPTGWGYASLLPDSTFGVYGVTEDALDAWEETSLNWENAPANDTDGSGVDNSKAVRLGSFTMAQGVLEGAVTVRGEALAKFLQNDANRYATLVVVRETTELKSGGAVHGFAGNNHPTLKPPTLRVMLK